MTLQSDVCAAALIARSFLLTLPQTAMSDNDVLNIVKRDVVKMRYRPVSRPLPIPRVSCSVQIRSTGTHGSG